MVHSDLQFEITPYESAGSIRFGMTSDEVRAQLQINGGAPQEKQPVLCDTFEELGMRVHYRLPGAVEAIEFRSPARPVLEGRQLLLQRYGDLESWLRALDPGVKLDHSGLTSDRLGIRLYASSARNNPDAPVEVVTVFERAYYTRYIASILPPPSR
jgi:hypothetical protein